VLAFKHREVKVSRRLGMCILLAILLALLIGGDAASAAPSESGLIHVVRR